MFHNSCFSRRTNLIGSIPASTQPNWERVVAIFFAALIGVSCFLSLSVRADDDPFRPKDDSNDLKPPVEFPRISSNFVAPIADTDDAKPKSEADIERLRPVVDAAPDIALDTVNSKNEPAERKSKPLFGLDIEQLGEVKVKPSAVDQNNDVPSTNFTAKDVSNRNVSTIGEMLESASSVNVRRTSAINMDALVRGYKSQQTVASVNGMNQQLTRVDIDSLFSQVDPGIVQQFTVIDGPYSSLYGPGFAFLLADLNQGQRYETGFQGHASTLTSYGTNGNALYNRETIWGGGKEYSFYAGYGLRNANDYFIGGGDGIKIPSEFSKQDAFIALSRDLMRGSRLDFDYLRTELNNLQLPGIAYDVNNSTNNQFNVRYVVQQDKQGPEQFVLQSWFQNTEFDGDSTSSAKHQSFYDQFITFASDPSAPSVNTFVDGATTSIGTRAYSTIGDADELQLTFGADWRRSTLRYKEANIDSSGGLSWGGNLYGIPASNSNDTGLFMHLSMNATETTKVTLGSRLDYAWNQVDPNDPVITTIIDPADSYYIPGVNDNNNVLGMAYLTQRTAVTQKISWNSGVAFAMRNATMTELYSDEPFMPFARLGNAYIDGNSDLAPEQNLQFDLASNYTDGPFAFGVRGYCSLIHNYILPVPMQITAADPSSATYVLGRDFSSFPSDYRSDITDGSPNADNTSASYIFGNISLASLIGLDSTVAYRAAPWLNLSGTVNYVNGTNWAPEAFVLDTTSTGHFTELGGHDSLPSIYPLNGTLRVMLLDPNQNRWSSEFVTRLVASQRRVAATLAELPTDGFFVCSIRNSFHPRDWISITTALENLFNQNYTQHGSLVIQGQNGLPTFINEPGFSFYMGCELTR